MTAGHAATGNAASDDAGPPPRPVRVAVPREVVPGERRVAIVPRSVAALRRAGAEVLVEEGAGAGALIPDADYAEAGATVVATAAELLGAADLVLKVQPPSVRPDRDEVALIASGAAVVGMLRPAENAALVARMAERGQTALSLERLPRTTRAQDMDALSSMRGIAGYHAVLDAAVRLPKFFPLLMTAAGTVHPAKVLVLGAGVAGLSAIATAHRLGAVVSAFDVRSAAREQVESLGASFVEVAAPDDAEGAGGYARALDEATVSRIREGLARHVRDADVVVTTAQVPEGPAPVLIDAAMVGSMRPGSVIVDLAAESGGNCAATVPDVEVDAGGVVVLGPTNPASAMSVHASQMYSQNITRFALALLVDGRLRIDVEGDDIVRATCVAHGGRLLRDGVPLVPTEQPA